MIQQFHHRSLWLLPAIVAALSGPTVAQPAPVPPPLEQAGADCNRPQYASDMLVCGDPELRARDGEVAALAQALPALAGSPYWEDQSGWIRRRSRCAFDADHRACLVAAYADRRTVLIAATASASRPLRCDGPWRGRALLADDGAALAIRGDGQLLAVASLPASAWQPWVTMRQSGRRITLQPQQGPAIHCRLG